MKKSFLLGACVLFVAVLLGVCSYVPAEAKMKIPKNALLYNGHYYYYYEGTMSWEEAEAECEKLGGHLVVFSDKDEEDAIWNYIVDKGSPAWIGLYNAGVIDKIYGTCDDKWKTVTGEKIKYTNWAEGQPDHMNHFVQNTYDMWAAIGKCEEVTAGGINDGISPTPSWGDFDNVYAVTSELVKGYVCEWDIYEIEVEKKTVNLKKGKTYVITYTVYDAAGHKKIKDAKVSFKTLDKKIATVTKAGKVKGVKKGKVKIKLTYKGSSVKVTVNVK